MKFIYKIVLIILLAGAYTATAQTTEYNPVTDSEYRDTYTKLKKLYIAKLDSESHYRVLVLSKEFVEKMNHPQKANAFMYVKDPLAYIKENLNTTSFESYEAAVTEWEALSSATRDEWQQNREYYKLEDMVRRKWNTMLADVTNEIELEHPEKFDLLEKPRRPE